MEYTLKRSNRKTVAIYVRNGGVEVRAPLKMPVRDIEKFVASKKEWIAGNLAKSQERLAQQEAFSKDYGDMVTYRGVEYPIVARAGNRVGFGDEAFFMPPGFSTDEIIAACVQIYRLLAKRDLTLRTLDFAKKMGCMPCAVKINGAKSRWGSCSGKKSINFSWRLIMADDDVVDYVVVHELAHLSELNHSDRFWGIVEGVLPDFRERKVRLRGLQVRLGGESWG